MLVPVLKRFPYSVDGINARLAEPNTQIEIPAVLVPGLEREGYIGDPIPLQDQPTQKMQETPAPENRALMGADENRAGLATDGELALKGDEPAVTKSHSGRHKR